MKNRYKSLQKWVYGGGAIFVLSSLPIFLIAKVLGQNDVEKFFAYAFLLVLLIFIVYFTGIIVKMVQWLKYEKQEEQEILENAQKELTSEFKKVRMSHPNEINTKLFDCQAKVDTDGKIVCKILLDYETKFDSYEEFLRFFSLDENS